MKSRVKRSRIWALPRTELERLIATSTSISGVLRALGLRAEGGNSRTLKAKLAAEGVAYRFPQGRGHNAVVWTGGARPLPDEEVFRRESPVARKNAKRRIIKRGLLPHCCSLCGVGPEWRGKPLTLILDHINGVFDDHRLDNLRFVCPNCGSQLETHCGRNKRR